MCGLGDGSQILSRESHVMLPCTHPSMLLYGASANLLYKCLVVMPGRGPVVVLAWQRFCHAAGQNPYRSANKPQACALLDKGPAMSHDKSCPVLLFGEGPASLPCCWLNADTLTVLLVKNLVMRASATPHSACATTRDVP